MPGKRSAGLLLFRNADDGSTEVLIGHMGGPFWAGRDTASWSIPKGEYEPDETPEAAARREFTEELGLPVPPGELVPLGESRQSSGKIVTIWAIEADLDPALAQFGTFTMEWPRGSGVQRDFPEIDEAAWCTTEHAYERLVTGQRVFLERLARHVEARRG
ncbi:NUDIX domain-containing protein [Streptomyces albidochromogenes]|uniref:NUDIX domain-containing protein n=1 Tax=Streptomyces albidochromogenes TaxID=329524 RepID=UPI00110FD5CE|nr:NUDIX domain-containing protein [Streptomyces albidochromogenes]